MKINEIEKYQNIWYHGSGMDFDHFDLNAEKANRGTNIEGIYLIKDEDVAREYAAKAKNGIVYEVEHDTSNPYIENKTKPSKEMIEAYIQLLAKYTNYSEKWARTSIAPDYIETGRMKLDLDGRIKRKVLEVGGYDSYFFNDMGDMVLVVFDPSDITILNKFTPQKLVKDIDYDEPIAKKPLPKEKPAETPDRTPRPDDDDALGQLMYDFTDL